jgi:hypothetical protein
MIVSTLAAELVSKDFTAKMSLRLKSMDKDKEKFLGGESDNLRQKVLKKLAKLARHDPEPEESRFG